MNNNIKKLNRGEKLQLRHIGSGFVMAQMGGGMPSGRKLAKAYADQYNRTYVQINGGMELVTEQHGYIGAE